MRAFKLILALAATCTLLSACLSDRIGQQPMTTPAATSQSDGAAKLSPLPLPNTLPLDEYEAQLYAFLDKRAYDVELGWARDKQVRDTGPFIDGRYYGTHPAVRIFYSPEVIAWIEAGRVGDIPDGAMIVKEMLSPPAARYEGITPADLETQVCQWTTMVRDSAGSKDGWFWSFYWRPLASGSGCAPSPQLPDSDAYPFDYPNSGFGQYCVRCHASAANEFTFSSLDNIEGYPGEPLIFRVDDSWRPAAKDEGELQGHAALASDDPPAAQAPARPLRELNNDFVDLFDAMSPPSSAAVVSFPPVTHDHVVSGPQGPEQFITSDQCLSCHDGQTPPFGPNMFIPAAAGEQNDINLSPYGEWNWSMMGLAGRDPIFFAQLESELTLHPTQSDLIQDTCFRCHGVMGQRQLHIDSDKEETFHQDLVLDPDSKYGALARDGISCTVCHQIVNDGKPLSEIVTGRFSVSTPGQEEPGISQIYGPYQDPVTLPMETSLGMKPMHSEFIQSSALCSSCHTIALPVFDAQGNVAGHSFEQVTFLEWANSDFRDGGATAESCQSCHMPTTLAVDGQEQALAFRIANIEDQTYPQAEHLAPIEEISVPIRDDFARHTLLGINQWGLEMFNQFDDILGVRKKDYMTGSSNGLPFAIEASDQLAKQRSADVKILTAAIDGNTLTAEVQVTNLTGHRFPSGVGFRRAFLELSVVDNLGNVVWASGRTNSLGVIVDGEGKALPSEFLEVDPATGKQTYQPHYEIVTQQNQAQVYQELVTNTDGQFTTSFVGLCRHVKDNRLLARGWTAEGPAGFPLFTAAEALGAAPDSDRCDVENSLDATGPVGQAEEDPDYQQGTGSDLIRYQATLPGEAARDPSLAVVARLYYQAIPPSYLMERFRTAQGENGQRLYYLASHLNTDGTNIEDWKLLIDSDESPVGS